MKNKEGKETMGHDPIVEEIHAMRERHARKFDYDMEAIVENLKRRQQESDDKRLNNNVEDLGN